jgi:phospholipid/cholesterol/gamma-HCH transport system substrate-binding protein
VENRAFAFAAGLFTVLLGAGVVLAAMWLSGDTEARAAYWLESRHPVTGLNVQAPVRLRGVQVGRVEAIEFDREDPRRILIRIAVRADAPITRGTYARLGSQGVTGLAYVMLDDEGANREPLPSSPEARIPVRESFLDEVSDAGRSLLAEATEAARRLNALLDGENRAQLLRTLASLESATRRAAVLAERLEPGARGLGPLAEEARRGIARAEEMFATVSRLARELERRAEALERVAAGAESVGSAARATADAALSDTLPRLHAVLDELGGAAERLERLLARLDEEPASLLFGRPQPEPGPGEPGFRFPEARR